MIELIRKSIKDSAVARWSALLIVAFTMMMGYYITYEMSPLEVMLESPLSSGGLAWTSSEYGFFSGSYGFLNVFLLMLFVSGIILDKIGVRYTGIIACSLMIIGTFINYYSLKFISPTNLNSVNIPLLALHNNIFKTQVILSAIGFSVFGVGCEMCGITVSKVMVKWFTGHEMALAMGIQVALARLGTGAAIGLCAPLAHRYSITTPVLLGIVLLCIGLLAYIVFCVMDKKFDESIIKLNTDNNNNGSEEKFKLREIKQTFRSPGFWLITLLCLFFYTAVNPFLMFATKLMVSKYGVDADFAGFVPSILPFGTIILTPIFGTIYDRIGKGATLLIIGSAMLTMVHICFALPIQSPSFAIFLMIILGIAFSLVPSAMWPSVPKIIPLKRLGTAYSIIFFIQNIGLTLTPILIGKMNQTDGSYTMSMLFFSCLGIIAFIVSILLFFVDKKIGYNLQKANIKQ
jgi:nitrate/nitrite transporter NarK